MKKIFIVLLLLLAGGAVAFLLKGQKPEEEKVEEHKVKIIFQDEHIATSHDRFVHIDGNKVTIRAAGTYVLRGRLTEGQIIVDAGPEDEIILKFNNVSVHCSDSAPLWIRKAGKVKIRLKDESENDFSDGSFYKDFDTAEKKPKACIDARCDLNIKGDKGSLKVEANYRDGIYTSDDLKIKSGDIQVKADRDAVYGKDSVRIEDGSLDLEAGRDGIHTDGSLEILSGTVDIRGSRYGLYAFTDLTTRDSARVSVGGVLSNYGCAGTINLESEIRDISDSSDEGGTSDGSDSSDEGNPSAENKEGE